MCDIIQSFPSLKPFKCGQGTTEQLLVALTYVLQLIPHTAINGVLMLPETRYESYSLTSYADRPVLGGQQVTPLHLVMQERPKPSVAIPVGILVGKKYYFDLLSNTQHKQTWATTQDVIQMFQSLMQMSGLVPVKIAPSPSKAEADTIAYNSLVLLEFLCSKQLNPVMKVQNSALLPTWKCLLLQTYSEEQSALLQRVSRRGQSLVEQVQRAPACPAIDKVLRTGQRCSIPLTQNSYYEADSFGEDVLRYLIQSLGTQNTQQCIGRVYIAVDEVKKQSAVSNLSRPAQCTKLRQGDGTHTEYWLVSINFVPPGLLDPLKDPNVFTLTSPWKKKRVTKGLSELNDKVEAWHRQETQQLGHPPIGHGTLMLIDHKNETIEYFEPNGGDVSWSYLVIGALKSSLGHMKPFRSYTWVTPQEYNPVTGLQRLATTSDAANMCAAFASLYGSLRGACPNVPREALLQQIVGSQYLRPEDADWSSFSTDKKSQASQRINTLIKGWNCLAHEAIDSLDLGEIRRMKNVLETLKDLASSSLSKAQGPVYQEDLKKSSACARYLSQKFDDLVGRGRYQEALQLTNTYLSEERNTSGKQCFTLKNNTCPPAQGQSSPLTRLYVC